MAQTNKPWLSIILPTFNGEAFLEQTLESIRIQEISDIEIIVVDDDSTDNTLEIVRKYVSELPIKILSGSRSHNWVASSNIGIRQACGQYICILHQDDYWLPQKLEIMHRLSSEHPEAVLILNASYFVDRLGNRLGRWTCPFPKDTKPLPSEYVIERLIVQNFVAIPAPIIRRDIANNIGGLDEALWFTADWKFWLGCAQAGPWVYTPEVLSCFRIHSQSQTIHGSRDSEDFSKQYKLVLDEFLPLFAGASSLNRAACYSAEVNSVLAALFSKQKLPPFTFLLRSLLLGPSAWLKYIRYSRILERVLPRLHLAWRSA